MNNEPIMIERTYDAPVEKVWAALTDKDVMKQWYFDVPEFRPEVGNEFTFTGGPDEGKQYEHLCRVTQAEQNKVIAYTWRYEGYPGDSEVTFELFPEGDKTRLKLTHTGLESFGTENPDLAKHNFVAGWTEIVNNMLTDFLAK
jgi:uncharacterized protein YndB with AHSA1/START domain